MTELKNKLMEKIEKDEVKMRSRSFFVFMRAVIEVILAALVISAIYLINLAIYLPKRGLSPMGRGFNLNMILTIVPWHYLLIGALGLGIAFWVLYRFTGTYKKHFIIIISIISLAVLLVSGILAFSKVNENLEKRPHLRGIYRMEQREKGLRDGSGRGFQDLK